MPQVVGIRFKSSGKIYYFDPTGFTLNLEDSVIVETANGNGVGKVAQLPVELPEEKVVTPLKKVIRMATEADQKQAQANQERAKKAIGQAMEKVNAHNLDMRIVDAEYAFDQSKVIFFFTADGRIDFRELVKDLASIFRTRVELRQIGVRDKAKMVGGLGCCGRPLCCATFLEDFEPVSIKMAKEQDLSLNPLKISGVCSRLMCCLKYENEVYKERNRERKAAAILAKQEYEARKSEVEEQPENSTVGKPKSEPKTAPSFQEHRPRPQGKGNYRPTQENSKPREEHPRIQNRTQPQPNKEEVSKLEERAPRQEQKPKLQRPPAPRPVVKKENVEIKVVGTNSPAISNIPKNQQPRPQKQWVPREQKPRLQNSPSGNFQEGIRIGMQVETPEGLGKVVNVRMDVKQATVLLESKSILEFPWNSLKKK